MAIRRRRRYNPANVRAAQLDGARRRLTDLQHHRPDLDEVERAQLIAETQARIAELETRGAH